MDPLQLLTRSAKPLRNTGSVANARTPSRGALASPQLFANGDNLHPNLKRKRGSDSAITKESSNGIDFFTKGQDGGEIGRSVDTTKNGVQQGSGPEELSEIEASPRMGLEERKRILREQKLKITLLTGSSDAREITEKRKRKKAQGGRSREAKNGEHVYPEPLQNFRQLKRRYKLSTTLLENVLDQGFTVPTEVQMGSLPILFGGVDTDADSDEEMRGHNGQEVDLLTVAPTGSGKTLAFLIPLLHSLSDQGDAKKSSSRASRLRAIILAPTKELVQQIVNEGRKLARGLDIRIASFRKGLRLASSISEGVSELPDILVATPVSLSRALEDTKLDSTEISTGTTSDEQAILSLSSVQHLILDEADVLLDPLFRDHTMAVWKSLTPQSLRVSLWSATISSSVEKDIRTIISSQRSSQAPIIRPLARLVVGLKDSAVPNISHRMTYCATEAGKLLALRELLNPRSTDPSTTPLRAPFLVFTQTIPRCASLHNELKYDIPVSAGGSNRIAMLHSDLPDKLRDKILTQFRKGEIWILITTDLLARGVDFRGVNGVVNYDVPTSAAGYVHRVGRTGRQGREGGVAVTLYTKEDIKHVKVVANVIAAAQKARGGKEMEGIGKDGVQQWLLDALPDVSKTDRKKLKTRGVEERRQGQRGAKITSKSGYVRREENKKRQQVQASQKRTIDGTKRPDHASNGLTTEPNGYDSDFSGFSD